MQPSRKLVHHMRKHFNAALVMWVHANPLFLFLFFSSRWLLTKSQKTCLLSKTVSDLFIANAADTFLYEGIGYYGNEGSLGVLSEGTHNFYPYVDGKIIDEDPYNRGVQVPAVFGSSMHTNNRLFSIL